MSRHGDKLFVYGALLDSAKRARLLGRIVKAEPARLKGYERRRRRYFYLAPRDGSHVDGEVLHGLGDADFCILDEYEEVPLLYSRARATAVSARGKRIECWVYLPAGWEKESG